MFSMMQVPKMADLRPMIRSENALSDSDFKMAWQVGVIFKEFKIEIIQVAKGQFYN